ncbi:MAG: cytidine deaminase [Kiritimatiellia bacterium]
MKTPATINHMLPELRRAARAVRRRAYAPYSGFRIGAAVLAGNGCIYTGANVENASYGLTICAERSAVSAAVAAGQKKIRAVLISANPAAAPCGACRQVLVEFAAPDCPVYLDQADGRRAPACLRLDQLLPCAFRLQRSPSGGPP